MKLLIIKMKMMNGGNKLKKKTKMKKKIQITKQEQNN